MKSPKELINSVGYCIEGIITTLKEESSSKIQVLLALVAIFLGFYFQISNIEWIVLVLSISAVISAEIINSAIENLADRITTEKDPYIKKAKDMGAGAVLIIAIGALITGCIIFIPKFID